MGDETVARGSKGEKDWKDETRAEEANLAWHGPIWSAFGKFAVWREGCIFTENRL